MTIQYTEYLDWQQLLNFVQHVYPVMSYDWVTIISSIKVTWVSDSTITAKWAISTHVQRRITVLYTKAVVRDQTQNHQNLHMKVEHYVIPFNHTYLAFQFL